METYPQSPLAQSLQYPPVRRAISIAILVALLISTVLLLMTAKGYGTLQLEGIPAGATATLNGHAVSDGTFKLRPGDYQLVVTSPVITPYERTIHVGLLRNVDYKPTLQPRDANAIADSLLGAVPGTSIAPQFVQLRWFESGTWAAGMLTPTNTVAVIHYDAPQQKWVIAFCNAQGYPDSSATLPADVAAYIQPLLTEAT